MKKTYAIVAMITGLVGIAPARADEELPMPRPEAVPVPDAVAPSGPCGCFPYWRQRLDEWIMFQPLYHPHVCSTCCKPGVVPCCYPPLYAFFLGNCPVNGGPCATGCAHVPVMDHPPAPCAPHPILTFWQRRACTIRNCVASGVASFKMWNTCPECGKTIYFALWSTHHCEDTVIEPPAKAEAEHCTTSSCGHKRPWFALFPCSECAKEKQSNQ